MRAGHSEDAALPVDRRTLSFPAARSSLAGHCLALGEPVVSNDLAAETRYQRGPLQRDAGFQSVLAAPIPGTPRPFGALVVQARARHAFTGGVVRLCCSGHHRHGD